jgi:hypothetical protein
MTKQQAASKGGQAVVAKYGVDHMRNLAYRWHEKYELKPYSGNDFLIVERATGRVNSKTLNGERYAA